MNARAWPRLWHPLLAATLVVAATACVPRPLAFRPDRLAPSVATGDVRVILSELVVPSEAAGVGVVVQIDGSGSVEISSARLAPERIEPCRGGTEAGLISVDGRRQWRRPVPIWAGQRATFEFPVARSATVPEDEPPPPASLDLLTSTAAGGSRCVRLPLPPDDGGLRRRGAWSGGASLRIDPPILAAFSGVARVGRWIGPVRLGGELGLGLRRCHYCLSPVYFGLPAALTIEWIAARRSGPGVGLEAAYTVRPTLGADGGDRYFLHGPRLTLRVLTAAPRDRSLPGGPQSAYSSVDVFVARLTAAGVDHWAEIVGGLAFTWDAGL